MIYQMILKVKQNVCYDKSLFSVVHDIDASANDLNHDLDKLSKWAFQRKINFNPDPTKQALNKKKLFLSTPLSILITLR